MYEQRIGFLIEVYRESGSQVRNIVTLRNTFLSFYMVALAAFFALLAQREDGINKLIWVIPAAVSVAGLGSVIETRGYIQNSLRRQELIAGELLDAKTVDLLGIPVRPSYQPLFVSLKNPSQHFAYVRTDMFLALIYLIPMVVCGCFAIWGDFFGLTS